MVYRNIRSDVDRAIESGGALWMYYRDNQGKGTARVVEPLGWENEYVFRAYCHLRSEERNFKTRNVEEWQLFPSAESALAYDETPPESTQETQPAVLELPEPQTLHKAKLKTSSPTAPGSTVEQVKTSQEWSRLLSYYAECLVAENRQQYVLRAQQLQIIASSQEDVRRFMQGESRLVFQHGGRWRQNPVARFIDTNRNDPNKKLCLGYPFLVMDQNQIAPLIYTPVEAVFGAEDIALRAEEFEISYAALKSLQLGEEEISAFITDCDRARSEARKSVVEALEQFLIAKITEIYQVELPKTKDPLQPASILTAPALFWVSGNSATAQLILELEGLARPEHWAKTPMPLKQLLSIIPDHDYPAVQPWEDDPGIYVTPLNQQQVRAVQSVRSEPVVVVTGPPGTGKSQLVLNLIGEAFLRGETVLFASRNNRAVDVVMSRLQNELQIQAAIRTGNKEYREKAVAQMRAALNQVSTRTQNTDLERTQKLYYEARQQAIRAKHELEKIRNLNGLLSSCKQERTQYLGLLPTGLRMTAEQTVPAFVAAEAEELQSDLSSLLEQALKVKAATSSTVETLHRLESTVPSQHPLLVEIHHVMDQWGTFGEGFLGVAQDSASIDHLTGHVHNWFALIDLVERRAKNAELSAKLEQLRKALQAERSGFPQELVGQDEVVASQHASEVIGTYLADSQRLQDRFTRFASGSITRWERFLNWVSRGARLRRELLLLRELCGRIGLLPPDFKDHPNRQDAESYAVVANNIGSLLSAASLSIACSDVEAQIAILTEDIQQIELSLPSSLCSDVGKLGRFDFDNAQLRAELSDILASATEIQTMADGLVQTVNNRLNGSEYHAGMLGELRRSPAGADRRLWNLDIPAKTDVIANHLRKWQNLVSFWRADSMSSYIESQLCSLPTEQEALNTLNTAQSQMVQLSSRVMRATWLERVRSLSNDVLQKTYDYVAAVEALTGPYDPAKYGHNKTVESDNLASAVQVFPIWATTNLSARSNFPLSNGFFDLVVIDEASQCDFPSALPLLYRGRKVVIIGDPNQLRHVAALSAKTDQELAANCGVGIDAFLYRNHSLYDIAQRSSGTRPGALLLNEHYRSDERIISFSNEEFYSSQLVIKTDLTLRNMRRSFLNQFGGVYWSHVAGEVEYPGDGSLCNRAELGRLQSLLPRFARWLRQHELEHPSIGIVTPYRAQAQRIQEWLGDQYDSATDITAGTAHAFQGDEKDFVVFSTVLAKGIRPGSLEWLQQTRNLLNVAVTRARVALIVVGDWNFCQTLETGHCFRHLAEYVAREPGRITTENTELPIFGPGPIEVAGVVLDPHNREYNRTTLRRFVSSCSEFVWWMDPYFNNRVIELWRDVFQDQSVSIKDVRLLTAREVIESEDGKKPQLSVSRVGQIRAELAARGIQFELRVLSKREMPHDRLFYAPGQAINMPPFAGAYGDHRYVSEYTRSGTNRNLFLEHWRKASDAAN